MAPYAARVYVQSDGKTVQVFQMRKLDDCPEYVPDGLVFQPAPLDNAEAIGRLVQAAVQGSLNS